MLVCISFCSCVWVGCDCVCDIHLCKHSMKLVCISFCSCDMHCMCTQHDPHTCTHETHTNTNTCTHTRHRQHHSTIHRVSRPPPRPFQPPLCWCPTNTRARQVQPQHSLITSHHTHQRGQSGRWPYTSHTCYACSTLWSGCGCTAVCRYYAVLCTHTYMQMHKRTCSCIESSSSAAAAKAAPPMHTHLHANTYTHTHMQTHLHTYTHIHSYTHIHTYTHVQGGC